ncbi:MAG: N-acetylmuramoyl-L-alanine amidase [Gaiellaceae bacterium]
MRRFAVIAVILVAATFAPEALATASAPSAQVRAVELAAVGAHSFTSSEKVGRFTLAGIQWRGPGRVLFRSRSLTGRWSPWRAGAPEDEDGPDSGSREARGSAWTKGNPWWVGPSDAIEARSAGRVSRIRAHLVWSPGTKIPLRLASVAGIPQIVPRLSWGADETIRRGPPAYAASVRFSIVHHTAGHNDYSRSEAPAIVKGIQLYHVQANGWNDIGYNFLVDRFGTVYEGRFGGIDQNVVGAHAQGFNTGSMGIALIGTYGNTQPSKAAQDAIARLVAWRLDLAHLDPTSFLTFISGGSERYASGIPVVLSAISGHRDTGFTECPGNALYSKLNSLAASARGIGLPKIFDPRADVSGPVARFRAELSSAQPWTVAVTTAAGMEMARGSGVGADIDWTWDSAGVAAGSFIWTISAGSARPANGGLRAGGATPPLAIEAASADPEAISPNGDGQADSTVLTYRLNAPANLTIEIVDSVGGVITTLVDRVWTRAGQHTVTLDGAGLADGRYGIVITARTATGMAVQSIVPLTVIRTLSAVSASPAAFSPNGDGRRDRLVVSFSLTAAADVRIRIERDGRWVASPLFGSFLPGPQRLVWNGSRVSGTLRDGAYEAIVEAQDEVGGISYGVPFVTDTIAPRVRILPGQKLRVELSEPAMLTLRIDGRALRHEAKRGGIVRVPWDGPANRVRAVAWDAAGNVSGPVVRIAAPSTPGSGQ